MSNLLGKVVLPTSVRINGSDISGSALIQLLTMVTNPDPTRWFRFEKGDGDIIVHSKMHETEF